jgi:hypothetical protein
MDGVTFEQPELVGVPAPTREHPGRCRLPTRFGAEKPCPSPAEGIAAEWTAPLDPAQAIGSCCECAGIFRLRFTPF